MIQSVKGNKGLKYIIENNEVTITDCGDFDEGDIFIPDTIEGYPVISIGNDAFDGCTSLTGVKIPNSVTSIGKFVFWNCRSLTNITIPDSVTSIGERTFYNCTSLTSVTIPDSVTSISEDVFYNCTSLTNITVDSNNTEYSSDSYGVLFNKDKTDLMQYPSGNKRTSYTIPDSVTIIDWYAFYNCTSLISVTIPDSVTIIDWYAFYNCTSLISVTIGNSVTSIGSYAFSVCTNLTSVTIPDSVTSIGEYAFYNCLNLKSPSANYKAFNLHSDGKISCRDYEFCENKWSKKIENIELCESGYHYCTNLFEIFDYYYGALDKDIAIYLCDVGDKVVQSDTSKCVTNKIKPIKRLCREDVIRILNGETV